MATPDPFYIIRGDVTETLNSVQTKLSRFHGLKEKNPERQLISKEVDKECVSISWQLDELDKAVDVASADPARFSLTSEELNSRRRWIAATQKQVKSVTDSLRAAVTAPGTKGTDSRYLAANDRFMGEEFERQQLLLRKQDEGLDEIEESVIRLGRLGRVLGNELQDQDRLLNELDQDMDTTHSRMRATQRRMQELIRKSGGNTQFCVLIFLVVVLVVLLVFALM